MFVQEILQHIQDVQGVSDDICSETTFSAAPHLHVSVLKCDKSIIIDDVLTEDSKIGTNEDTYSWRNGFDPKYVDPFNYEILWKD